jgi:hypothetical protein
MPIDAVAGLLDAFDKAPLVALGERHRLQELADFLVALMHHPRFPETVQALVVEFGNARYQALIDRFVGGEPVANSTSGLVTATANWNRGWRHGRSQPWFG